MDDLRSDARRAGVFYALAASTAPFTYLYVPDLLLAGGNALATAERVRAHEALLRTAILTELFGATMLLFAALALYRLFKRVDPRLSKVIAAMMLVSVPISFVNSLFHIAPLLLLKGTAYAAVLDPGPLAGHVMLFLRLHASGLIVNQIFWGLWLIPIGILVMRSGFFPRWLGIPLFFAGTGYVLNSLGTLLLPQSLRWTTDALQLLGVGEMPFFSFYLFIWGVRGPAVDRPALVLFLLKFVFGAVGLGLLMTHRIEPAAYAGFVLASLTALIALVLRWRSQSSTRLVGATS